MSEKTILDKITNKQNEILKCNEQNKKSESTILISVNRFYLIDPFQCFDDIVGHAALDRNPGPGYDTLLLRLIPGRLYSACLQRQFHTLSFLP